MKPLLAAAAIVAGMIGASLAGTTAHADPGQCSFQGEYFTQYYPCTQPPAWLMQPGVRSDMRPGAGTSVGPFNQ
jgi:hypothetical protein